MARATVLVVDRQEGRRRDVARGLASFGYEVVAASDLAEGQRYATGLNPDAIVAEAALAAVSAPGPAGGPGAPSVHILLCASDESPEIPGALAVSTAGLASESLLLAIRTGLLAHELGLACGPRLEAIEGSLQTAQLLDLLPRLQRAIATGRVLLGEGEILIQDGEVIASGVGALRGVKAFVRLARTAAGTFRIVLGPAGVAREIPQDLLSLMALAMEDDAVFDEASAALPDLASRVRVTIGPSFFATQFSPIQQRVLGVVHDGGTVWDVVDQVPEPDGAVLAEIVRLGELGFLELDPPDVKVAIMADSAADLPAELAERHRIRVVPLTVLVGREIYKDGVDLSAAALLEILEHRKGAQPETRPPTRGEFLAEFRRILARNDLVSVHISGRLSETVEHARAAAEEGREDFQRLRGEGTAVVEVVDSLQVSVGLGLMAVFAARMAARRLSAGEIRQRLEALRPRVQQLFVVETLEHLARGGRIGKARSWFGGLLGIVPILGVVEGEVTPIDRVRGKDNALPRMVALLGGKVAADRPVLLAIGHAGAPAQAVRLRSLLHDALQVAEVFEAEIGPAVSVHVGPGCVGAAIFQPTDDEAALIAPLSELD